MMLVNDGRVLVNDRTRRDEPIVLESHPKLVNGIDDHGPMLELVEQHDRDFRYRFRDTGIRVEVDGEEYVPDAIGPVSGSVTLRPKGDEDGMVKADDDHPEVTLHVDMTADIVATGVEPDARLDASSGGGRDDGD